jgi:hypothetical protein
LHKETPERRAVCMEVNRPEFLTSELNAGEKLSSSTCVVPGTEHTHVNGAVGRREGVNVKE